MFNQSSDQENRQSSDDQDIFGNINFGEPQPPQYSQFDNEPSSRRGSNQAFRACLLAFGFGFICIVCVCLCFVGVLYSSREAVPALMWVQFAGGNSPGGDLQDAIDLGLVCEGSQAEQFTLDFIEFYGGDAEISLTDETLIDADNNAVEVQGTLTFDGVEQNYNAIFFVDPDQDFLLILNCISEIQQTSPSIPTNSGLFQ